MKQFPMKEIREALAHAQSGEQALHVHNLTMGHRLFKKYREIAHLFDMDADRLKRTATKLGVRVIKIERAGTDRQHIDLCGKPFEKAIKMCKQSEGNMDYTEISISRDMKGEFKEAWAIDPEGNRHPLTLEKYLELEREFDQKRAELQRQWHDVIAED